MNDLKKFLEIKKDELKKKGVLGPERNWRMTRYITLVDNFPYTFENGVPELTDPSVEIQYEVTDLDGKRIYAESDKITIAENIDAIQDVVKQYGVEKVTQKSERVTITKIHPYQVKAGRVYRVTPEEEQGVTHIANKAWLKENVFTNI